MHAEKGIAAEIVEDHIRNHLVERETEPGAGDGHGIDELVDVVHSYFK